MTNSRQQDIRNVSFSKDELRERMKKIHESLGDEDFIRLQATLDDAEFTVCDIASELAAEIAPDLFV